jgi:hypothetical protein
MGATAAQPLVHPPPAKSAVANLCDLDPDPATRAACKLAKKGVDTVGSAIPGVPSATGALSGLAQSAEQSLMQWLTDQTGQGVVYLMKDEVEGIQSSTTPQLTAGWFLKQYSLLLYFAGLLAGLMFFLGIVKGAWRSDLGMMLHTLLRSAAFFFVTGVLPYVMMRMVDFLDKTVAPVFLDKAVTDFDHMQQSFSGGFVATGVPLILLLFLGILGIVGGFLGEVILILRMAMFYYLLAEAVFALAMWIAGREWSGWANTSFKNLVGLSFMKVYMALILLIGVGLLDSKSSLHAMIAGVVVLFTLPASTYLFYRKFQNLHHVTPYMVRDRVVQIGGGVRRGIGKLRTA